MDRQRLVVLLGVAVVVAATAGGLALAAGVVDLDDGPTTTVAPSTADGASAAQTQTQSRRVVEPTDTVRIRAPDGRTRATVDVAVADSQVERYRGLSDTAPLENGTGLLFVHPEESTHAYVMRAMHYPLDIVFVAADGTVTRVHHAPLPPEGTDGGNLTRYEGRGRYVLEVPLGYTNRTNVSTGDRVVVPARYR